MNLHSQSDYELVRQYLNGQTECLEVLINKYKNRVFSYIMMVVKDRELAEDIFQDTFIKVIRSLDSGSYKDDGRFCPWVMRIAHNLIVDYFRRLGKMPIVPNRPDYDVVDTLKLHDDNAEKAIMRKQTSSNVRKLVKMLPPEQRRVVILRHYGKFDFKEIAERTGVSINTALGRMRYAIINLRRLAKEHNMYIEL